MKIILGICFLYITSGLYAQNKFVEIKYLEKNITNNISRIGYLVVSERQSFYKSDEKIISKKKIIEKGIKKDKKKVLPEEMCFKDLKKQETLIQIGKIPHFIIKKNRVNNLWVLKKDVKYLNNYMCKKAVSKNKYGTITAWYTDDIGISGAPRDYDGLPGLIIYLETPAFVYSLKNIKYLDKYNFPKPNKNVKILTQNESNKGIEIKTNEAIKKRH